MLGNFVLGDLDYQASLMFRVFDYNLNSSIELEELAQMVQFLQ